MKLKSIASILKKRKIVHLVDHGVQVAGDESAYYPLYGLPKMSGEELLRVIDVPEDKKDDYEVFDSTAYSFSVEDNDDEEEELKPAFFPLTYMGGDALAYRTESGKTVIINSGYLAPLDDESEARFLFLREGAGGAYVAVKCGMLLKAVIRPEWASEDPEVADGLAELMERLGRAEDEDDRT